MIGTDSAAERVGASLDAIVMTASVGCTVSDNGPPLSGSAIVDKSRSDSDDAITEVRAEGSQGGGEGDRTGAAAAGKPKP